MCGLILVLGIVSFMQNHYDAYWKKSQTMTVITVNGCESQTPEAQLQIKLEKAVEDYMNLGQMIKQPPAILRRMHWTAYCSMMRRLRRRLRDTE